MNSLLSSFLFMLTFTNTTAGNFQRVTHLTCPAGEFVVDARPWGENEAGGSKLQLRYRFRGVELAAIHYEAYFHNLVPWLRQNSPRIYNLGMNLDTSGASKTSEHDRGDTLYLPPSRISRPQVEQLFDCLAQTHAGKLREGFERVQIQSRTLLGLMKTRTGTGRNGVARLVHAEAPLTSIYGSGAILILVSLDGAVLLQSNLTANNPAESVRWGDVLPSRGKRPTLHVRRELIFAGERQDARHYLLEPEVSTGRRLQDDFHIQWLR